MHDTALELGKGFFDVYWKSSFSKILDVGSRNVNGTLREVCPPQPQYVGIDVSEGEGVDLILSDPYSFPFQDESFDCIVSSSCFEHDPMFWLTFLECLRVLKKDGFLYINAPSNGPYHTYAIDCWRFYPDAGNGLKKWAIKNGISVYLTESFTAKRKKDGWNDFVAIFSKSPVLQKNYLFEFFPQSMNIFKAVSSDDEMIGEILVINNTNTTEDMTLLHESYEEALTLTEILEKKEKEIVLLNKEIRSMTEILEKKEKEIVLLNKEIRSIRQESSCQLKAFQEEREKKEVELSHIREGLEKNRMELSGCLSSRSWKVTKPLRFLGNMGRSIKSFLKNPSLFLHKLIIFFLTDKRKKTLKKIYQKFSEYRLLGSFLRKIYSSYKSRYSTARLGYPNLQLQNYQDWIDQFDTVSDSDKVIFRKAIETFSHTPLISVVMPVYNTPKKWLVKVIESVRRQIYPHWELCISDNASTLPEVRAVLEEYRRSDPRIHVIFRDQNGHICANSNTALTLAKGEFIALLDSDDELPEHALFWVVQEINQHPEVDLIYSDEDKITEEGIRYDPYCKPDWNPALMLSQNTFSHLGVYRHSLLNKVGGFREGFEGSQDWDLVLRCSEETTVERIRHIPRILYHWRAIPGSTACSAEEKPYAWMAGKRAIEEHLERLGIPGAVSAKLGNHHQVSYLPDGHYPRVSIVIPSACNPALLKRCIESLLEKTTYPDFEILLVVNEIRYAVPEQAALLNRVGSDPRVTLLVYEDQPFNYSKVNNWAISQCKSSTLCLMNDDIEVISHDWLEKLVRRVRLPGVGAVGPMLLYPDNRIQHAGVILGLGGPAGHQFTGMPVGHGGYFGRAGLEQDLSCVTAACMVLRKEVFDAVGRFSEDLAIAFNDVDLCIRIRESGWRILWTPEVELYHHENSSIGRHDSPERSSLFQSEVALMKKIWGGTLDKDPFYNPNLSFDTPFHELAFPPRISKLPNV